MTRCNQRLPVYGKSHCCTCRGGSRLSVRTLCKEQTQRLVGTLKASTKPKDCCFHQDFFSADTEVCLDRFITDSAVSWKDAP